MLSQLTDNNTKLIQINFYTKIRLNYFVPILFYKYATSLKKQLLLLWVLPMP